MRLTLEGGGERASAWFEPWARLALLVNLTPGLPEAKVVKKLHTLKWIRATGTQLELAGEPAIRFVWLWSTACSAAAQKKALTVLQQVVSDHLLRPGVPGTQ